MAIKPQVFIFIGRSGCGKGTQAKLLMEKLKKLDANRPIVHLETGKLFREFIKEKGYTRGLSKKIYDEGGLQPEFLVISMWSQFFIAHAMPDAYIVMDGTPRKYHEAFVLDSAVKFYKWPKPHLLYINISRESAIKRLMGRGRIDDNADDINARLDWFDTDVAKALSFYENSPDYFYHDINGEQSPDMIQKEIFQRVGLPA